jgi:hypothetical protein
VETLIGFLRLEIGFLLGAFLLLALYKMLTGEINLQGLLIDSPSGEMSAARLQLLLFTLAGALYYIYKATTSPGGLPEIPPELILFLGGSQIVYLGSKTLSLGED